MENRKIKVMYLCHAPEHRGGAALSLLNLIHAVSGGVEPLVVMPNTGEVYDMFTAESIECAVVPFPCTSRKRYTNTFPVNHIKKWCRLYRETRHNMRCLPMLDDIIRRRGIQIVHSNSGVFTIGAEAAARTGVRHVWHLREFQDIDVGFEPLMGWCRLKKKIASADAVIAITDAVARHFDLAGRSNYHVIWDAVKSRKEVGSIDFDKDKYFLFCAATLSRKKGAPMAIEAFACSGLAAEGYRLEMAGKSEDKPMMAELAATARRLGVTDAVDYPGYCADLTACFSKAAGFLMCSDNEGMGRVTVEAMFSGCPVIAKRSGGTVEFVADGRNGLLYDTVDQCAGLMRRVVDGDMGGMERSAQAFALEHFTEEGYGRRVMKIYNDIL